MKLRFLVSFSRSFDLKNFHLIILFVYFFVEIATPSQSLMVLRCCGNLVPDELPENRTILVQQIWQALNQIGMKLFIHYK